MSRITLALVAAAVVLTMTAAPADATLNACSAGKKKCVSKKVAALLKCHTKAEKPPAGLSPADFAACVQRAKLKFDGGTIPSRGCFAKLEAKYGASCLTTNDTAALEDKVDAFIDDTVCELDSGSGTCPSINPCHASAYPACGGDCLTGQVCSAVDGTPVRCACVTGTVACNTSGSPTCGGACPANTTCTAAVGTCDCQPN